MRDIGLRRPGSDRTATLDAGERCGDAERRARVRPAPDGRGTLQLSVPGIRCGGCVAAIERALSECPGVVSARANLTLRRVNVTLEAAESDPAWVLDTLSALGHAARPLDAADAETAADESEGRGLLRATAVAGFGAMNIMLLSVAVWSGAEGATRETFHLVSGLIAVPVVAYAEQPFFRSAFAALRSGRLNMDVPISVGVLLALALSLFETARGGHHGVGT